jgi:hypothetical protein
MNDPQSTYCENIEFRNEIFGKVENRVLRRVFGPKR